MFFALLAGAGLSLASCSQTQVSAADAAVANGDQAPAATPGTGLPSANRPGTAGSQLVGLGGQPGPANALALDASANLVAATDSGPFTLAGGYWRAGAQAFPGHAVALASSGGALYIGVDGAQGGVFRQSGSSWEPLRSGLPVGANGVVALAPAGDGGLYASDGSTSIYALAAGASTWEAIGPDDQYLRFGAIATAPDGSLYAGGASRRTTLGLVWHYADGKWSQVPGATEFPAGAIVGSLAVTSDGSLLASLGEAGVYSLASGAKAWTRTSGLAGGSYRLTPDGAVAFGPAGAFALNAGAWQPLPALAGGATAAAVLQGSTYVSADGGVLKLEGGAWKAVSPVAPHLDLVDSLAVSASGDLVVGAYDRVLHRSGGQWSTLGKPLEGLVKAVAFQGETILAGTAGGSANGVYAWNGSNWSPLASGLGTDGVLALTVKPGGAVFAGTNGSGVYRLDPNAAAWTRLNAGLPDGATLAHSLAFDANGALVAGFSLYGSGGTPQTGVYRWDGKSWSALGSGLPDTVSALATRADGSLVAATRGGAYTLNGKAWTPLGTGLPKDGFVTSLTAAKDGSLLAGVSLEGAYRLSGNQWERLPLTLFDNPTYVVAFDPRGNPLVGTTRGVFGSL